MLHSKLLTNYSKFAESHSSEPLAKSPDYTAKMKRLGDVQHEWQQGVGINYVIKSWQQLHKRPIDASTGSSGFLLPEAVEAELHSIAAHEMADYIDHLPLKKLAKAAKTHFTELEIIDKDTTIGRDPYEENAKEDLYVMHGHGTSELFSFLMKAIIKTSEDAIIAATPTYGLFVDSISQAKAQLVTFPLTEKNHYKPTTTQLRKLILQTNANLLKKYNEILEITKNVLSVLGNQKAIPQLYKQHAKLLTLVTKHNQLVYTELDAATEDFNTMLEQYLASRSLKTLWQEKLALPLCPRVRSYFHINPHMPFGSIMTQLEIERLATELEKFPDITVIDDITYYELILPPSKKRPGTFAKTAMQQRSVTLYSLSKQYGLAAVRAGIALGPKDLIKAIAHQVFMHVNMPSIYTQKALYSVFNMPENDKQAHIEETSTEYAFRRDFTLALVKGISDIANKTLQKKITTILTEQKISSKQQEDILKGIPGLKVVITPESGFFLLLDFSAFQGKYIGNTELQTSMDMQKFIYCLTDVNMIPNEVNFEFSKPWLRFSFCMPTIDILEAMLRLRKALANCTLVPVTELIEKPKGLSVPKKVAPSYQKTGPSLTPLFDKVKKQTKPSNAMKPKQHYTRSQENKLMNASNINPFAKLR
ncbi:aminotransferase class I/II-fold pyridoxal phosphate-dependent enzyme [Candidatus Berkiella aquae]|nr:pyridoxal phosphate-dependent aminotransferase [Candidatus Berkiella aquae]MCS5710015.1 pyridoxal phosphate-dependent aminotransferase [Candidatus Berkiella aquae]